MKRDRYLPAAWIPASPGAKPRPPAREAPECYLAYPGVSDVQILSTSDGLKLYGQWWTPADQAPRAIVLLLHGTAAHTGVYAPWANHLIEHGYAMFAFDMRGWGQSQGFGRPGYTRSPNDYLRDISLAFEEVRCRYPDTPVYLQGESLGAGVALQWSIRGNKQAAGLILNAPPVVINLKLGPLPQPDWFSNGLAWHAGLIGRLFPNAPIYPMGGLTGKWVWRQAIFDHWARKWVSEEVNMTRSSIAASYVTHLQSISSEIRRNISNIETPIIVLQGGKDNLVSHKAAKRLANHHGYRHMRKWKFYKDMSHCTLHDTNKEKVWADIVEWLNTMTLNDPVRRACLQR